MNEKIKRLYCRLRRPPQRRNIDHPIPAIPSLGINKRTLASAGLYTFMFVLCAGHLFLMHYTLINTTDTEAPMRHYEYWDNAASVILDVSSLLVLFLLVTGRRIRPSMVLLFMVTLLWSLSNIIYSRFFGVYISVSAIAQISNMTNSFMLECLLDGLSFSDGIFFVTTVLFFLCYKNVSDTRVKWKSLAWWLLPAAFTVGFNTYAVSIVAKENYEHNSFWWNMNRRYYSPIQSTLSPQLTNFTSGSLRVLVTATWSSLTSSRQLTAEERKQIEDMWQDKSRRITPGRLRPDITNVVFIIVESYLSLTADMNVGGTEVTPYLDALRRDSNVYYNAQVRPDISIGESSDGQFIYMTGILPLKRAITINKAKSITLPGLASIIKENHPDMEARMVIPTLPSFWSQSEMCQQYGFDRLYSAADYKDGEYGALNDEQIFDLAMDMDSITAGPFFSVILTMSMHSPYSHAIETDTILTDKSLPEKFCNYLTAAHYTDRQIARYIESLRRRGLYEKTLIIITADHHAHDELLDMKGKLTKDTPLFIINGDIDNSTAYHGPCHQLDVYTTILDVLFLKSKWRGLGHTLLNKNYVPSVNENTHSVSEYIIHGDYFK